MAIVTFKPLIERIDAKWIFIIMKSNFSITGNLICTVRSRLKSSLNVTYSVLFNYNYIKTKMK